MTPPTRLLDLTRLLSRLGKGQPTGVDRVEAAYLAALLAQAGPVFGLVKTRAGFLLLDRIGLDRFNSLVHSSYPLPTPDMLSKLMCRGDSALAAAESALRKLAVARCLPLNLPRMLRRRLPQGFSYLNTGHANLNTRSLTSVRAGGVGKVAVLVHDTIPLDHPEFTRPDTIPRFHAKIAAVSAHADLVIHTARATRIQTEIHFAKAGRVPDGVVAPLGISPPPPLALTSRNTPYFVALGTIEPRKNHALLLDIWEQLHRDLPAAQIPHLLIIGRRGWSNDPVFKRLDDLGPLKTTVFEMTNVPDDIAFGLLARAKALLFPSFVEGFGLPPLEAAQLGTAVIVPPLPIYRETLGDYPVYAALDDSYSWMETIIRLKDETGTNDHSRQDQSNMAEPTAQIPRWPDHFNDILSRI